MLNRLGGGDCPDPGAFLRRQSARQTKQHTSCKQIARASRVDEPFYGRSGRHMGFGACDNYTAVFRARDEGEDVFLAYFRQRRLEIGRLIKRCLLYTSRCV